MSWHTYQSVILLRKIARRFGLTRVAGRFMNRGNYEAAFDEALFAAIKPGNVVWDVGANVGYYTRKFAEAAGPDGMVIAFEPFPATVERLRTGLGDIDNVIVQPIALGADDATMTMKGGEDEVAATSRIIEEFDDGYIASDATSKIEILTADSVVRRGLAKVPTVAKIDTEGFELDVLKGMREVLANPAMKGVFVEVHFGLLAERGMPNAPVEIENLLRVAGFDSYWVDPSHIAGVRT